MIDKSPAPGEAHLRSALSQLHADCMCTIKGAIFPVRKKKGEREKEYHWTVSWAMTSERCSLERDIGDSDRSRGRKEIPSAGPRSASGLP